MSLDRFSERIRETLDSANISHRVGLAAINDFMRELHETFVKGGAINACYLVRLSSLLVRQRRPI